MDLLIGLVELRHALGMVRGVTQNLLQGKRDLDTILLNLTNGSEMSLASWRFTAKVPLIYASVSGNKVVLARRSAAES